MARTIYDRLNNLKARRSGSDRSDRLTYDELAEAVTKSLQTEDYQKRATGNPYTEYALGAMKEVGPDYTRISLETANRVGGQIGSGLTGHGISYALRLQGSVPGNTHIRRYSDVDLLVLHEDFRTYNPYGARANYYTGGATRTSVQVLTDLRGKSETILKAKYPAATVDCSGSKAIKISGGSLPRMVDVVPSHWDDNAAYQQSLAETERGVTILDKRAGKAVDNLPFKHLQLLEVRDAEAFQGLKKAVRLCKNVKADADDDINYSSFDLASTLYHADLAALRMGAVHELAILAEAQRFLDYLYHHKDYARTLKVPDGTRAIFDNETKFTGMTSLSLELDRLARAVAKEQSAVVRQYETPAFDAVEKALREAYIPAAA